MWHCTGRGRSECGNLIAFLECLDGIEPNSYQLANAKAWQRPRAHEIADMALGTLPSLGYV
jgi:hypothetical protein